jgi:hypothetical protein
VDEIGLGSGVLDILTDQGYPARAFNSSRSAESRHGDPAFMNERAAAYWNLARLLNDGAIGLPVSERLMEELLGIRYGYTTTGALRIEGKDGIKSRIGRSPDLADAVAMAFHRPPGGISTIRDMCFI